MGKELLLNLQEHIETYENEAVVLGRKSGLLLLQLLDSQALAGSVVGQTTLTEGEVELGVDVVELLPHFKKLTLDARSGKRAGRLKAQLDAQFVQLLLDFGVADFLNLLDVVEIGEKLSGIGHGTVDIVEIAEQLLAPAIEPVERLGRLAQPFPVDLVEEADGFDVVSRTERTDEAENLVDGEIGRGPERGAVGRGDIVVEEDAGTLVGENNGHAA